METTPPHPRHTSPPEIDDRASNSTGDGRPGGGAPLTPTQRAIADRVADYLDPWVRDTTPPWFIDSTVALLVHDRRRSAYVEAITAREIARRLTVLAGGSVDARR